MCNSVWLLIILFFIFMISLDDYEDFGLINQDTEAARVNPSASIAPNVLQTGYSGCGKLDWKHANPEQVSAYFTCLNQMKSVAIKQLTGNVGSSPN
jgi:hypothetical protein